jgi:hypothetical protein
MAQEAKYLPASSRSGIQTPVLLTKKVLGLLEELCSWNAVKGI